MRGVESGSTRRPASSFPSASLRCGDTEGELELELDEEEDDDDGIRQTAPPQNFTPSQGLEQRGCDDEAGISGCSNSCSIAEKPTVMCTHFVSVTSETARFLRVQIFENCTRRPQLNSAALPYWHSPIACPTNKQWKYWEHWNLPIGCCNSGPSNFPIAACRQSLARRH